MSGGAGPIGAVGCAWTAFGWFVLGMTADDRRALWDLLRYMADRAIDEGRLMGKAVQRMLPMGRSSGGRDTASLADISEMIDVVRLGLSAGLSFDAALEMYCAQRSGVLSRRMGQARLSWQMGLGTREEELSMAARDLGARPLESFAAAVSQALSLGAPLGETLAGQSREIRAAHRASIEREIERIPVKLLIPTGTLILPALLLSIVGPLLAASGML